MNPQPGELWLADLGLAAKTRPVIIVSRRDPAPPRSLFCMCRLPPSEETVRMRCRCLGFRSLIVNQSLMFKGWDLSRPYVLNAGLAGSRQR